ncbi:MAG: FeoB small GTPase domain-containing protein [Syntrophotaleaceae bacterium]
MRSQVKVLEGLFSNDSIFPQIEITEMVSQSKKPQDVRKVILVGNPNVGKSVLFNALTGAYTVVSNYPGTSVAVSRGHCEISDLQL